MQLFTYKWHEIHTINHLRLTNKNGELMTFGQLIYVTICG